jgi:hypothetical protein
MAGLIHPSLQTGNLLMSMIVLYDIKMETRVQQHSTFAPFALETVRERIEQLSRFSVPVVVPAVVQAVVQAVVPAAVPVGPVGMIPFEAIYCDNDEDPSTLEPFEAGSHLSIYHSLDSRRGLEKPTCVNVASILEWMRSRPEAQDVVLLPIRDQFSYYVERADAITKIVGRSVGVRPLFIDNRRVVNSVESVYALIPFIPPNYPVNQLANEYPYDTIIVRTAGRDSIGIAVQRHTLVNRIYRQYNNAIDHTSLITIPELANEQIRLDHASHGVTGQNSVDIISNPRHRTFRIHTNLRTIVRR